MWGGCVSCPSNFCPGGRPVVRKFRFSPEDDPTRLVISNPVSCGSLRNFFSILVTGTNCSKLGKGRPRLETGSTDDGLLGFSKNRHNPVMVYNDLMIRNITVHNYNKDRSQLVTIQCLYTNRALISVRIIVPFFHMASRPLSAVHQLILAIDIV